MASAIHTQNVAINDNGLVANTHSILDVDVSTNDKGVLIPRLTTTERTSIAGLGVADEGLSLYDITTKSFWYWDGGAWIQLAANAGWSISGNAGTIDGTHFLGTVDNVTLNIRVNNQRAGRIDHVLFNTFWGYQSGNTPPTSGDNTGIGYQAMFSNTSGARNSSVGSAALRNNTSGVQNIAVGCKALRDNQNGNHNVAVGYESMLQNLSGQFNTGVGTGSLYNNTTASWNVAMGAGALFWNSIGEYNTGIGAQALGQSTTASQNTAVGFQALYVQSFNNGGAAWNSNNVAVGYQALWSNLSSNTTNGVGNTALGCLALFNNIDGFNNTAVGVNADVNAGSYNNSSCFGANSFITASNQVRIGNAAITSIGGQVGWTTLSDKRVKTNLKMNVPGIEFIKRLQPVTYEYDQEALNKMISPSGNNLAITTKNNRRYTGFLAQDVEKAANDLGFDFSGVDAPKNENDLYGLRYGDFTVPLVKAVQEQQVMIEDLQKQIIELQTELKKLKDP